MKNKSIKNAYAKTLEMRGVKIEKFLIKNTLLSNNEKIKRVVGDNNEGITFLI